MLASISYLMSTFLCFYKTTDRNVSVCLWSQGVGEWGGGGGGVKTIHEDISGIHCMVSCHVAAPEVVPFQLSLIVNEQQLNWYKYRQWRPVEWLVLIATIERKVHERTLVTIIDTFTLLFLQDDYSKMCFYTLLHSNTMQTFIPIYHFIFISNKQLLESLHTIFRSSFSKKRPIRSRNAED